MESSAKKCTDESITIFVKKALSKFQRARNWALKKAAEILEKNNGDQVVEIIWKPFDQRGVKVDDFKGFVQDNDDKYGRFHGPFAHLALPGRGLAVPLGTLLMYCMTSPPRESGMTPTHLNFGGRAGEDRVH